MPKKPYFDPVNPKEDFPALEKRLLKYWYEAGIVNKYLTKNNSSTKKFSFLDGPITANNPMGVHHAWGRTYKDLWQRYKNMQGFKQRFQNGFDCQGLWVEVEVEKELGLKTKRDIENLVPGDVKGSIAKFVELCKERAFKYAGIQTEQSKRLGYFMDWVNSYYTLSDENNYSIWHFLKKCYEKGLIYKGRDSVPWCPRCGTAISQHEMLTEDYKEVTHDSVYIEYPVIGKKNTFLLVWTTTPWTLLGNVAVAVDRNLDYVYATSSIARNKYILLRKVAERLNLKVQEAIKGEDLEGLEYESPFDHLPRVNNSLGKFIHKVVLTDTQILPVSEEEGTGLVHVAPGAGTEDFQLGKKVGLPIIELIDEEATYLDGLGDFSGKNAKKHPEIIFDELRKKEDGRFLFDIKPITHRYPACWRCKSELVWRVVDEWYIAMDPLREPMKKVARKINWIPEFGLKRELDWLNNMHDWLISKKRYWGLALPIWECKKCGHFEVIGGKDELKKKAIEGWEKFDGHTPHRPWIDEVKIKCEKCGSLAERITDVGNPWLDAGIVPYSTLSEDNKSDPLYWQDKKRWKEWFPPEFITESFPGQFKNWFYSMIAMSTVLENVEPFKNVLGYATLLAEDGRPMHKSWGNTIEFNEGADAMGVDVMRWMYVRQNPSENLLFGYKVADETRRKFHLKLWNIYNFFVTYSNLDGWVPANSQEEPSTNLTPLDKWILSRFSELNGEVSYLLDEYDAYMASGKIEEFVDDLSLWYIRRSRDRVGLACESEKDRDCFYSVCYKILVDLSKMLAVFTPFLAEDIYKNLTKNSSVHLESWPVSSFSINKSLLGDMATIRLVVEKVHAIRKEKGIPVRQPLATLSSVLPKPPAKNLYEYLLEELNVKEWKVENGAKEENLLDTTITPELEEEARVRELIRKVQDVRKEMNLDLSEEISITSPWLPREKWLVERLKKKIVAQKISLGEFKVIKV